MLVREKEVHGELGGGLKGENWKITTTGEKWRVQHNKGRRLSVPWSKKGTFLPERKKGLFGGKKKKKKESRRPS